MSNRCRSKNHFREGTFQCESYDGHYSVHYNGDYWWPNNRKFPWRKFISWCLIFAAAMAAAVALILL